MNASQTSRFITTNSINSRPPDRLPKMPSLAIVLFEALLRPREKLGKTFFDFFFIFVVPSLESDEHGLFFFLHAIEKPGHA